MSSFKTLQNKKGGKAKQFQQWPNHPLANSRVQPTKSLELLHPGVDHCDMTVKRTMFLDSERSKILNQVPRAREYRPM
jgi:hypothetical protein